MNEISNVVENVVDHVNEHRQFYLGVMFGIAGVAVGITMANYIGKLRLKPTYSAHIYHNTTESLCRMQVLHDVRWGKPVVASDVVYDTEAFKDLAEAMIKAAANAGMGE